MKKLIAFLTAVCVSVPLWGCYDNRDIDKTAYVIAVGIDKGDDIYNYTFQISSPLAMGGGGEISAPEGEENSRAVNIVIGANDLYEARNKLNSFLSKTVNMSHLKMIAFSMETAKEGFSPHMTFLLREREVRPNTKLCVTESRAEEFLRGVNPALEANTAEYYDLIAESGGIYAPSKTLREFINENAVFASALPLGRLAEGGEGEAFQNQESKLLRVSTSKAELSGLCLIKDYKAVGVLPPLSSGIFGLITGKNKEMDLSILKDNERHMVHLCSQGKGAFDVRTGEDEITVNMHLSLSAEINSAAKPLSEKDIEDYLSRELYALFINAQKSGCDIFKAGNCLKRSCKTVSQWESLNWNEKFKKAYFMPYIKVTAERTNSGEM